MKSVVSTLLSTQLLLTMLGLGVELTALCMRALNLLTYTLSPSSLLDWLFGELESGRRNHWTCHLLSSLGSRRERCGYRIVRRQRSSGEQLHCLGKAKRNSGHVPRVKELLLSTLSPEQLVLTLLEAEPPNVLVSRPSMPFTEASMMMSLTKLADKELVHMIGWAKKIPGRTLHLDFILFICDKACLSYFGDSELHLDIE